MTAKAKLENYTAEMVQHMISVYQAAETDEERIEAVKAIAEEFGKTPASVRMKLVTQKVYVKPTAKDKTGNPVAKKGDLVNEITAVIPMPENDATSLEKATKNALQNILAYVTSVEEAKTEEADEEEEVEKS